MAVRGGLGPYGDWHPMGIGTMAMGRGIVGMDRVTNVDRYYSISCNKVNLLSKKESQIGISANHP